VLWLLPFLLLATTVPAHADCGDGILDLGEDCDDSNVADGDCCSASCLFEAAGSPCADDGTVCTLDQCDGAGTCEHPNAAGTQRSFGAVADTYSEDFPVPVANFGTSSTFRIDANPERRAYLRFDVSGLGSEVVQQAILRLETTPTEDSDDGGTVYSISDNGWSETTLNHVNRPAIDGVALASAGAVGAGVIVDFDVTAAVAADGTYSFALVSFSENKAEYRSRTGDSGRPQLIIISRKACDDGDLCTHSDACFGGSCAGVAVVCSALNQCHDAGTCDPATGICSDPEKADGTACDDDDACTQTDECLDGECTGGNAIVCPPASDQCHDAGVCDPTTGACSDPAKADGTGCDDGNACTQTDECLDGECTGSDAVVCLASDQCHTAGTCNPATGVCSAETAKANGSACNDGNACTRTDTCQGGACTGGNAVVCTAASQCHTAGTCNPATGSCSSPTKANGTSCNDGNACTRTDTCQSGACTGGNAVVCTAASQCHNTGTCNPATGTCSSPVKVNGAGCNDGDTCTDADRCIGGTCTGQPIADADGDGFCNPIDVCPFVPDAAQLDTDLDGVGDLCQCKAPAPGRCIAGGGSKKTDCLMEFNGFGPATINKKGKMKPEYRCTDGDPTCDRDGAANGVCTFGVSVCFGNSDPRLGACTPADIAAVDLNGKGKSANEQALEGALRALGLEIRRKGKIIAESVAPIGADFCTPLVDLQLPAHKKKGKQKLSFTAWSVDGTADKDKLKLVCK
jgi:cysteine-rich repeat protein